MIVEHSLCWGWTLLQLLFLSYLVQSSCCDLRLFLGYWILLDTGWRGWWRIGCPSVDQHGCTDVSGQKSKNFQQINLDRDETTFSNQQATSMRSPISVVTFFSSVITTSLTDAAFYSLRPVLDGKNVSRRSKAKISFMPILNS